MHLARKWRVLSYQPGMNGDSTFGTSRYMVQNTRYIINSSVGTEYTVSVHLYFEKVQKVRYMYRIKVQSTTKSTSLNL